MADKDKRTTQSKNEYFLLHFLVKDFTGKKLPSNRKVLGVFIKHHVIEKMALRKSATKTARKLIPIWTDQARIPVKSEHRTKFQIEALYHERRASKKL